MSINLFYIQIEEFFNRLFLDAEKEIVEIISEINLKNIRTLKYVFNSFYSLIIELKEFLSLLDPDKRNLLVSAIFLNHLVASNEYKEGRIKRGDSLEFANNWRAPLLIKYMENAPTEEISRDFIKKYHNINNYYDMHVHYFDFITEYIFDGVIYDAATKESLLRYIEQKFPKEEEKKLIDKFNQLRYFMEYEDDVFKGMFKEFLDGIQLEFVHPKRYLEFFMFINELDNIGILEDFSNWKEVLYKMLEKCLSESDYEITELISFKKTGIHEYDMMVELLENFQTKNNRNLRLGNLKTWFDSLNSNENTDIKDIIEREDDFFELTNELNILENYLMRSNKSMSSYISHLNHAYLRISNKSDYNSHEIPHIDKMINTLAEKKKLFSDGKIAQYNALKLEKILNELTIHLKSK
ncbi:hypothetical protein PGC35_21725 [Psychrobacillus sp. PGGUH221]|uniref:hypothetical protein n=1 Tax=Psychrobacillus sp. PGGUH221 TaxID=3020058 RepID=UPI0035C764A4